MNLLNLSLNPLSNARNKPSNHSNSTNNEDHINSLIDYFNNDWSLERAQHDTFINAIPPAIQPSASNLHTLILNSCFIDLKVVECLIDKLASLNELHLSSNNYSTVAFKAAFVKPSLKILYFNNNNLNNWSEVLKLGKCFPNLENLVLSHNDLSSLGSKSDAKAMSTANCFQNLQILIINKLSISEWAAIDQLREFPRLRHVRIQNIPLLSPYNDDEKYYLLVAHLNDSIDSLNGSKISNEDKENCERKFIRHFMDLPAKPRRYFELETKHGKLNKLADVSLEIRKRVQVKIKYGEKNTYRKVDVRQTVGDFKKQLEKLVGYPSARFKLFYIDTEACSMSVYGPEELKHPNRCLYSFNIRDGDEFEIDLKPPPQPAVHSAASDHQFQHVHNLHFHHYNSHMNNNSHHQVPLFFNASHKPTISLAMNKKVNTNAAPVSSRASDCGASRACKKTKSGLLSPLSLAKCRSKTKLGAEDAKSSETNSKQQKSELISEYCSLPANLNELNGGEKEAEPCESLIMGGLVVFTAGNEET